MQESSTDLRGFGLLPLAMKERHLLKADVSLSFRRLSAKGFSCGENACRTQKRKALKPDGFKAFCGGEGGIRTLETLLGPTRFPIVRARPNYATSPCLLCYYDLL